MKLLEKTNLLDALSSHSFRSMQMATDRIYRLVRGCSDISWAVPRIALLLEDLETRYPFKLSLLHTLESAIFNSDITAAVPVLERLSRLPDPPENDPYYYVQPARGEILEPRPFREAAVRTLRNYFNRYSGICTMTRDAVLLSLAELTLLERGAEHVYLHWIQTQPQPRNPVEYEGRLRMLYGRCQMLQAIAEAKARLAKEKDGELLTGETIPRPRPQGGLGRMVVKVH